MILDIFYSKHTNLNQYKTCCYQNCIRQIFEYHGMKHAHLIINTVPDILFLQDGDSFRLDNIAETLVKGMSECLITHINCSSPFNIVWEENLAYLKQGIPVLVCLDTFYLPYDKCFQKKHSVRWAIMSGYLESSKEIVLIDYSEENEFNDLISFELFRMARESENPVGESFLSGVAINNSWAVCLPDSIKNFNIKDFVIDTMTRALDFYKPRDHKGKMAIMEFFDCLNKQLIIKDTYGKTLMYEYCYKSVYAYIYVYRSLFELYISITLNIYAVPIAEQLIQSTQRVIKTWETLLNLLLKANYLEGDFNMGRIQTQLKKVMDEEESLFYDIIKVIEYIKK